ncbi:MAG: glycosyltransferase family 2 protein [Bacteroidales bacterium]|jgi:GT2 family glycosyltransferase|nr:glycosyltransferase family 2 protein [Bacteroidales bacterium]
MTNDRSGKQTAIVILNWNGRHYLERFLPSVEMYSQLPHVSVVVADNGSTDDSLAYLRKAHPRVRIVALDANYGFAEGYNQALQQVDAAYYVLLNSDVEVTEGWLPPLISMMEEKENIAACMPKIKSEERRDYFEHAGAAGGFIDKYGYAFCRGRLFDTVERDNGQYDEEAEIFWATGACCIVNAALFRQAGCFDGTFFAHMEEIDLCWRWKNAGYRIWYTPRSTVYHVGGGMLPQNSPFKTFLNYRNNLLMMYKNLPRRRRRRILMWRRCLDYVAGIHSLFGSISIMQPILKAHRDFGKMKTACKHTPPADTFPSCVYAKSIIYQYFIGKKKQFTHLNKDHFLQE